MIEKITIQNNVKSWSAIDSNVEVTFGQKNIIYGLNGSGKSSFAKILAKHCFNLDNARFFGRDYIRRNVMLKNEDLKGVKSDFSNKNVEIEAKIESKQLEIEKIKSDIEAIDDEQAKIEEIAFDEISTIVKRRKAGNAKINNKPTGKTLEEVIQLWETDYKNAKNKFPNEDFSQVTGKADYSSELKLANDVKESNDENFNLLDFEEINEILQTNYNNIGIPSNEIIGWIEDGVKLHKESAEKCFFCGCEKVSINDIKTKLETYKNDSKSKAEAILKNSLDSLNQISENISLLSANMPKEIYEQILDFIESCNKTIQNKINNMATTSEPINTELADEYESNINAAIASYNTIRNTNIKNIEDKINRLSDLVKGAIGKEISENELLRKSLDKKAVLNKQLLALEKKKEALENDRRDLIADKNDINDFKEYLNKVFLDLGLDFELILSDEDDKSYSLVHRENRNNKLTLSDISEGEERLLALIYFYYEMHKKPDDGILLNNIETIIIDDPICSLDDNNRFYIQELLKSILAQDSPQTFILTHSWDDFCGLCYSHENQYNLFEIRKEKSISSINRISNSSVLKPYRLLFNEVYSFSKKNQSDITDSEVIHMPNTLRRVLEEYLNFRINIDRATQTNAEEIFKLLTGKDDISKINLRQRVKLNTLLSVCNVLSHGANSQARNKSEILAAAKTFVGCLKKIDKFHINKMVLPER